MANADIYREEATAAAAYGARADIVADRLDLQGLWLMFRRRLRVFFYTAIIIFDIMALLTVWLPPRYTATAVVILNGSTTPVTPSSTKEKSEVPESNSDVETEIAILTSRDIAAKVVDYLHLENDPDMRALIAPGGITARIARSIGLAKPVSVGPLSAEDRARLRAVLISRLASGLTVERVSSAYAFSVGYTDSIPIRATAIANAFAHIYTEEQIRQKQVRNQQAVKLLGERIEALKVQAQADFDALQRYRIDNNLLSTTGATLTEQEISAYNQQVASARAEAAADSASLSTARTQLRGGSAGDDVGAALSSPVIQSLRVKRAELSARVAQYAGTLGPRNPDFLDALRELADVDAQIQSEINRTISNLDARANVSRQRLDSLSGSLGGARGTLEQNNRAMVALDDLQRKADTSQALYESYLNRYKEAVAASGAERAESRLVSDARIPTAPSFPKRSYFLALGLLLGLGAGFVAAIATEMAFSGLTSGEDVKRRLGVPYLGGMPDFGTIDPAVTDPLETVRSSPRSPLAQAVRGILTKLRQTFEKGQVVMISSALPAEGKTTLTACLAQAAVGATERVIVIDCDSTRRQFSTSFAKQDADKPGLREVLAGEVTIAAALQEHAGGFHILPITSPFGADEAQIDPAKMQALLAQLREHFGLILLDTAPILPVAEGRELAALADTVILAGRWRHTSEKALATALDLLPPAARAVTSIILSRINMKQQSRFTREDAGAFYHSYKDYYHA
ncbi:MAG: polysaccharide biosynthesis tyrosine autokinase [Sphingobium sp.]|nr:polysaccharide biosynthesis tyrosine autokinase [Sphingobium sp.]MBP6112342.1 polysaccharide biosynthesis tyrosine autokinase [Sphingobium sp.]MBP9157307.1 polysaccharide biosynthesis tyrosine autokinase [Sphingobium sp.]MCC6482544.1 polysaccharide biosynthesis tyrosine autokinase [Sphingomonadaceae bacterium]